jgi:hypothetical protein
MTTSERLARIALLCRDILLDLVADLEAGKVRTCRICGGEIRLIDGRVVHEHVETRRVA